MAFYVMYKKYLLFLIITFLQGCGSQTSSYLGAGLTLASGGTTAKSMFATGTNLYIENKTGKNTFQHVREKTIDSEIRKCEITHSAEINKIFFETLDEINCKL
tara:strand:+ start:539 stop:847 length:309 start_codon:yes stop_codon:yes gene_type:complete